MLVAVDGSEFADHALVHAMRLKQEHGWSLQFHLLNVQQFLAKEAAEHHLEEFGLRDTRDARARLDGAYLPYRLHIVMGYPAETIVHCARELGVELIVIGSRGMGAIEGLLLGSVAYKVAHLSSVPVTLCAAAREAEEKDGALIRILLPVDATGPVIGPVCREGREATTPPAGTRDAARRAPARR